MIALHRWCVGNVLCSDHTFIVPQRISARDALVSREFSPYQALHGVVNEREQLLSIVLYHSTSMSERNLVAKHLKRRYQDRSLDTPIMFQDNCCMDRRWLEKEFGTDTVVLLDNFHLISSYREKTRQAADACSLERQRILMRSIIHHH